MMGAQLEVTHHLGYTANSLAVPSAWLERDQCRRRFVPFAGPPEHAARLLAQLAQPPEPGLWLSLLQTRSQGGPALSCAPNSFAPGDWQPLKLAPWLHVRPA